ncbi:MAG: FecR domain-containing protein [Leptospiraceae bacterium]|nr:FecR domain-containing protein [Leptospiraceae bacterium]
MKQSIALKSAFSARTAKNVMLGLIILTTSALVACGGKPGETKDANAAGEVRTIVSSVVGSAQLLRAGAAEALTAGQMLQSADTIKTGDQSAVELAVQGFGVVKVGANTEVGLAELVNDQNKGRVSLDLKRGDVASVISRQDAESEYSIRTPTAIAGVRGTAFIVSVGGGGTAQIAVLDGSVAVSQDGQEVILEKNSRLVVQKQQKLSRDMVQELSPENLKKMQDMTVFHKSNVLEFNTLIDELQQKSSAMTVLEGETDLEAEMARRDRENSNQETDSVRRAERADISKTLKRDTRNDPLKIEANKSYEQE